MCAVFAVSSGLQLPLAVLIKPILAALVLTIRINRTLLKREYSLYIGGSVLEGVDHLMKSVNSKFPDVLNWVRACSLHL